MEEELFEDQARGTNEVQGLVARKLQEDLKGKLVLLLSNVHTPESFKNALSVK